MKNKQILYIVLIFGVVLLIEIAAKKLILVGGQPFYGIRTVLNFIKGILVLVVLGSLINKYLSPNFQFGYKSFLLGSIIILLGAYCSSQSDYYYHILKISQRGWEGEIYKEDKKLGYANVANFSGFRNVPLLPKQPTFTDENGMRVAKTTALNNNADTSILFLGCSFTFGDACIAEETFSYKVGDKTNYKTYNAGVCGYGIAQMLLKGEALIPTLQPQYVVVQYSPWLTERSIYPFSPNLVGKVPTPIARVENDSLIITSPIFKPLVFQLHVNKFIPGSKSLAQYFRFYCTVGLPLAIHDNYKVLIYRVKEKLGKIKLQNVNQKNEVPLKAYEKLKNVCLLNNSELIVLALGTETNDEVLSFLKQDATIHVVDAEATLWDKLIESNQDNYDKAYKHWAIENNKSYMVDEHPNAKAHDIIAEEIVKAIYSIQ